MSVLHRLYLWLTSEPSDRVSSSWLTQHDRMAGRVGVDLPRWRLPKERAK